MAVPPVAAPPAPRPSDSKLDARRRIGEEHQALERLVGELLQTHELERLRTMLAELATLLRAHFETEEGPRGIHEVVGEQASHALPAVQRLFEEHRQILVQIEQLRVQVGDCLDGPVRRAIADVRALGELLERHEAEEEQLFADAFYTDLGGHT
jgi:hemerythrin